MQWEILLKSSIEEKMRYSSNSRENFSVKKDAIIFVTHRRSKAGLLSMFFRPNEIHKFLAHV